MKRARWSQSNLIVSLSCGMYFPNWTGIKEQKKSSHLFCTTLIYCKCMASIFILLHLYLLPTFTPLHFTHKIPFIERIILWELTRFGSFGSFPIVVKEMYWKKRFKKESKLEDKDLKGKCRYKDLIKHKYKYKYNTSSNLRLPSPFITETRSVSVPGPVP